MVFFAVSFHFGGFPFNCQIAISLEAVATSSKKLVRTRSYCTRLEAIATSIGGFSSRSFLLGPSVVSDGVPVVAVAQDASCIMYCTGPVPTTLGRLQPLRRCLGPEKLLGTLWGSC